MQSLSIILLFILGRLSSLILYRMCWASGATVHAGTKSAILTFLSRPLPWLAHVAFIGPTLHLTWDDMPALRSFTIVLIALLALGAIGRLGSANLNRFFFGDRCVVLALSIGVWFSPAFLYPCIIASCCLQYTVASWPLSPGYSNLLGFEFVRASLSVISVSLALLGGMRLANWNFADGQNVIIAAVLLYQVSAYVNHALAKSSLGHHWYSWIRENRLDCLVANAWLRGWTFGRKQESILCLVRWIKRHRCSLCASVWILEISWLVLLVDVRVAVVTLCATMVFHFVVFLLTGLTCYQYIVNHLALLFIVTYHDVENIFGSQNLIAIFISIPLAALWIKWLRNGLITAFQKVNHANWQIKFSDAADHLMAWWDTPLMRMFSYTVETKSAQHFSIPTPKLSPHDTTLTDIHTHLMILGQHAGLDPLIEQDKKIARVGVWGLTIFRDDRDFLYRSMDDSGSNHQTMLHPHQSSPPWDLAANSQSPHAAMALRDLFSGINRNIRHRWFHWLMRWPHFPGEDAVSDLCPLGSLPQQRFMFDEAVTKVTIWRIKTFLTEKETHLLSEEIVGCIHFEKTELSS